MATANRLTTDEITMVREYVFLPLLLSIVEKKKDELSYTSNPLNPLFAATTDLLMNKIHSDLRAIKQDFRKLNIKVVDNGAEGAMLCYTVYCRGYEEKFKMIKEVAKAELGVRLGKYVSQLEKALAGG
jgi:hypothetical protein